SCVLKTLPDGQDTRASLGVAFRQTHEDTKPPHAVALLRARRERPRRSRAGEQRYELAPPHSITSSARTRIVGGIMRPSAFAVVRFTTRSNLVGCSTGMSPG